MKVHINHKGPGYPCQVSTLEEVLGFFIPMQPFVFTSQKSKDYMDGLSLMTGREIKTMMWEDMPVDRKIFFTYMQIQHPK